MNSDTTILREKKPDVADYIETWRKKYQKSYDFTKSEEQATFYEGVLEMARFIATTNTGATSVVFVNTEGVAEVRLNASCVPLQLETSAS